MRPVLQNSEYHDFKKSDEHVLFAVAEILEADRKNKPENDSIVKTVSGESADRCTPVVEKDGTSETEIAIRKDLSIQFRTVLNPGQKPEIFEELFALFELGTEKALLRDMKQKNRSDGTVEITFSMSSPELREALQKFKEE